MALAVAGLVVGFVWAVGGGEPAYWFGGARVVEPGALLADADRRFLRAVYREDAAVGAGARCFFSRMPPDRNIRAVLRCGPVLHYQGDPDRPWDDVALVAEVADGRARLSLATATADETAVEGQALKAGEVLSRPDGRTPATATALGLPPTRRVVPGAVAVVAGPRAVPGADSGQLRGPGRLEVAVEVVGVAPTIEVAGRGPRRAAAGEEFVVFTVAIRGAAGTSLELVSGARRVPLPEEARDGRSRLAVSAPAGEDVFLEATYRGIGRALSVRTGEPAGPARSFATAPPAAILDIPIAGQEVPAGPTGTMARLRPFSLGAVELLDHSDWLGAPAPGRAWLAVAVDGFAVPRVDDAAGVRVDPAASFVVVLPGGEARPALEVGEPPGGTTVYFDVPADGRAFALRVAPTFVIEGGPGAGAVAFAVTEVPVELREIPLGLVAERSRSR